MSSSLQIPLSFIVVEPKKKKKKKEVTEEKSVQSADVDSGDNENNVESQRKFHP